MYTPHFMAPPQPQGVARGNGSATSDLLILANLCISSCTNVEMPIQIPVHRFLDWTRTDSAAREMSISGDPCSVDDRPGPCKGQPVPQTPAHIYCKLLLM